MPDHAASEKEKMLSGRVYSPLDHELTAERLAAAKLLKSFNVTHYGIGAAARRFLLKLLPGAANDIVVVAPFHCDYGYNIKCAERVFMNAGCVILDVVEVRIGRRVLLGPNVHIYTATHPLEASFRAKGMFGKPVTIGDDCWIGGGTIVLPGVSIGARTVVGAGSVVTRDLPPGVLAAGNPARVVREI